MSELKPYEHEYLDLSGVWNSTNGRMQLWFPVNSDSPDALDTPFASRRQDLLRELAGFTVSPEVVIHDNTKDIHPVSKSGIPEEEAIGQDFDLEFIVVRARFLSQRGDNALKLAGASIEDLFHDQMLERAQH